MRDNVIEIRRVANDPVVYTLTHPGTRPAELLARPWVNTRSDPSHTPLYC
ncbi:hypothetical protein [Kineobactrum salinum]|uniref:Uncharacterized protein n=1 Tax=Kineobactrum salinum TaxID=2708301 RepID=A0A6C0U5C5_9GAMM|nr:hypothetical protein [Kineobactrum salinum]QIB67128.1 hypothetical protein G3T16_18720 [Kineobactrum salinum]